MGLSNVNISNNRDIIKSNLAIINSDLTKNMEMLNPDDNYYNCWGFTSFIIGLYDKLQWMDMDCMNEILTNHTERIRDKDVQVGDIFAYYLKRYLRDCDGYGSLQHTGIITKVDKKKKNHTVLQKVGEDDLELSNIHMSWHLYDENMDKLRKPRYFRKII